MRALAVIPLLALTGCMPNRYETEKMLLDRGYQRPSVSAQGGWLLGRCEWDEPYTARFFATLHGVPTIGVVCAGNELSEGARLVEVRQQSPERDR